MGYAEMSALIHAPIDMVWKTLNDIDHTKDWVMGLEHAEVKTPGTFGKGSVYYDYNRLGPFLQTTAWTVTVFQPMRQQVHESDSTILPSTMTLILSPTAEGTRVTMAVDFRFLPMLRALGRLLEHAVMNRAIGKVLAQNLANLDTYLGRGARQESRGESLKPSPIRSKQTQA